MDVPGHAEVVPSLLPACCAACLWYERRRPRRAGGQPHLAPCEVMGSTQLDLSFPIRYSFLGLLLPLGIFRALGVGTG